MATTPVSIYFDKDIMPHIIVIRKPINIHEEESSTIIHVSDNILNDLISRGIILVSYEVYENIRKNGVLL